MKKIISAALAALLACGMAGCASDKAEDASSAAMTTAAETTVTTAAAETTVEETEDKTPAATVVPMDQLTDLHQKLALYAVDCEVTGAPLDWSTVVGTYDCLSGEGPDEEIGWKVTSEGMTGQVYIGHEDAALSGTNVAVLFVQWRAYDGAAVTEYYYLAGGSDGDYHTARLESDSWGTLVRNDDVE